MGPRDRPGAPGRHGYEQYATFHPTFLYEALWNLGVAVLVIWADRKFRLGHGRAFALYVMAYTAGRGWIEYLRIDTVQENDVFGLRLNVWTSIVVFLAALLFFLWSARRHPGREEPVLREGFETATDRAATGHADGRRPNRRTEAGATESRADRATEVSLSFGETRRRDWIGSRYEHRRRPEIEHEHPDVTGGWLRPAVFGASDGLVSNLALIAGVAGGTRDADDSTAVVLAGFAGLAAGAFSMAVGGVHLGRQPVRGRRPRGRAGAPRDHRQPRGRRRASWPRCTSTRASTEHLAHEVARQIHLDVDNAVKVHAREELGVDPHDLASPMLAAVSSFLAFGLGALVPLLPYLLGASTLLPGLAITLLALFGAGAVVTPVTTRPWWYGGVRQMLLGGVAAAITYGVRRPGRRLRPRLTALPDPPSPDRRNLSEM